MGEDKTGKSVVTLKLTKWEIQNDYLPPVSTVTLYEGDAPGDFLRQRIGQIVEKNPWLTSHPVKKKTADGVAALAYSEPFDINETVDQMLTVYKPDEIPLSLNMTYKEIVRSVKPALSVTTKASMDTEVTLFKVSIIPIVNPSSAGDGASVLRNSLKAPGYALVVSMNHTLGDGDTYYQLYGMLSPESSVKTLNPVRVEGFEEVKDEIVGKRNMGLFKSPSFSFGILFDILGGKFKKRIPQNVSVNMVDPNWLQHEKQNAKEEGKVPFVSSNDAVTSWFFRQMGAHVNFMAANFRDRKPLILGLTNELAGNYEAVLPYFEGDADSASHIRQSIRDSEGNFRFRRGDAPLPGVWKKLKNKTSLISNWTGFYKDLNLPGPQAEDTNAMVSPALHFPIMEWDGLIMSIWDSCIVFCPRAGELALLCITRKFDSDELAELKKQHGDKAPLAEPLF